MEHPSPGTRFPTPSPSLGLLWYAVYGDLKCRFDITENVVVSQSCLDVSFPGVAKLRTELLKAHSRKHRSALHQIPFTYKVFSMAPFMFAHSPRRVLRYRAMGHRRERTSALFTRLAHGLGRKRWSAVLPLSKSLGSPAPQTSLSASSCFSSLDDRLLIYPVPPL